MLLYLSLKRFPPTTEALLKTISVCVESGWRSVVLDFDRFFPWEVESGDSPPLRMEEQEVHAIARAASVAGLEVIPVYPLFSAWAPMLGCRGYGHLRKPNRAELDLEAPGAGKAAAELLSDLKDLLPGTRRIYLPEIASHVAEAFGGIDLGNRNRVYDELLREADRVEIKLIDTNRPEESIEDPGSRQSGIGGVLDRVCGVGDGNRSGLDGSETVSFGHDPSKLRARRTEHDIRLDSVWRRLRLTWEASVAIAADRDSDLLGRLSFGMHLAEFEREVAMVSAALESDEVFADVRPDWVRWYRAVTVSPLEESVALWRSTASRLERFDG